MTASHVGSFSKISFTGFPSSGNTGKVPKNTRIKSEDINKLLVNQGVSITQEELEKLLLIPGVKFDLPLNDQTFPSYIG